MFGIKNKLQPVSLTICLISESKLSLEYFLDIPDGGNWKQDRIGNRITIFDKNGNVTRTFDPQAGYSVDVVVNYENNTLLS